MCEFFYTGSTKYKEGNNIYPRLFNVGEAQSLATNGAGLFTRAMVPFDDELHLYKHDSLNLLGGECIGLISLPYDGALVEKELKKHSHDKVCGIVFTPTDNCTLEYIDFTRINVSTLYIPENCTKLGDGSKILHLQDRHGYTALPAAFGLQKQILRSFIMVFKQKEKLQYPSAELLIQPCFEDYKNELESYNKLYDKVNIALAFCGIVLLVFLDNVELSYLTGMLSASSFWGVIKNFIPLALCASSAVLIVLSTVQMLQLMKGGKIRIFDSVYFRNQKLYSLPTDQAALKLIDSFTVSTSDLRKVNGQKQKKYDKALSTIIIAVLLHAIYLITT